MTDQTPSPQSVELLPCPFCGTTAHVVAFPRQHEGRMAAKIECFTDFCYAVVWAETPSQAITAWNRRAAPAPSSLAGGEVQWGWRVRSRPGKFSGDRPWHWQIDEPTGITAENCEYEPVYASILAALSPEAPAREGATGAKAVIRSGQVVISIDIDALPLILSGSIAMNAVAGTFKVTDAATFAKEVCHALNDEKEDGTTRVHMMFDSAFNHAINQGCEGVEEISEDEFEAEANRLQEEAALTPRHEAPAEGAGEALVDMAKALARADGERPDEEWYAVEVGDAPKLWQRYLPLARVALRARSSAPEARS